MRMVIAGGRRFNGTEKDYKIVKDIVQRYHITEIVSGKNKTKVWFNGQWVFLGADYFGERCAGMLYLPVKPFPADWDILGSKAGPVRNKQMAEYTDYVFLFPGGRGTDSMRREAIKAGKEIVYDGKNKEVSK